MPKKKITETVENEKTKTYDDIPPRRIVDEDSFEKNLRRLSEIEQDLAAGVDTMEEAVRLYSEGITLADRCTKYLLVTKDRMLMVNENHEVVTASLEELLKNSGEGSDDD